MLSLMAQAADQIAASGGGRFEAAVCASLAGHVARILPVCGKWVDALWAFSRCWLELELDERLKADALASPDADLLVCLCGF
jgi:hypothetical protein